MNEKQPRKGVKTDLQFEDAVAKALKVKPPKDWKAVKKDQADPGLGRPKKPKKR